MFEAGEFHRHRQAGREDHHWLVRQCSREHRRRGPGVEEDGRVRPDERKGFGNDKFLFPDVSHFPQGQTVIISQNGRDRFGPAVHPNDFCLFIKDLEICPKRHVRYIREGFLQFREGDRSACVDEVDDPIASLFHCIHRFYPLCHRKTRSLDREEFSVINR